MTSMRRTIEQERSKQAWADVQTIKAKNDTVKKDYNSLVKRAPVLILTNGLGQTLAFLKAKAKDHHIDLFRHLSGWVCQRVPESGNDLLHQIIQGDSALLRRATREALAYLQWLKRFAEAELPSGEEEG